jgi:hypothetical protein
MTPVIMTILATPSFASAGSGRDQRDDEDRWEDHGDHDEPSVIGNRIYKRKRKKH